MKDLLARLGKYQIWANDKYREIISNISEEEWEKDLGEPITNVKSICTHIVSAVERCLIIMNQERDLEREDIIPLWKLSKGDLLGKWRLNDYTLHKLLETKAEGKVIFKEMSFLDAEDFLFQYINHSSYHRGQLVIALRLLEKEATNTDYLFYLHYLHEKLD
ncbi:MAG: DinB family protein [Candidatus Heimdallarchaeota archaeon]